MNIQWFPFDRQHCTLKFGTWSYKSFEADLRLLCSGDTNLENLGNCSNEALVNLGNYQKSGEFTLLG